MKRNDLCTKPLNIEIYSFDWFIFSSHFYKKQQQVLTPIGGFCCSNRQHWLIAKSSFFINGGLSS